MQWQNVKDVNSLSQYITEYYNNSTTSSSAKAKQQLDPLQMENGIPEYNAGKRKIIWRLKNVKG